MNTAARPAGFRALAQAGRVVVVVGPAGIGKSTAVGLERQPGDVVARCLHAFGALSYRPLSHALRMPLVGTVDDVAGDVVAALDGRLLVVEDLHWADDMTRSVLRALIGRVGMIVTSRVARPLGEHRLVDQIDIPALDRRSALALVRRLHPTLPADERERLLSAAAGNPLLLTHLVGADAVSPTLRAALADRVGSLPSDAIDDLGRLALAGAPMPVSMVPMLPRGELSITSVDRDGTVRFEHELFADAVLDLLGDERLNVLRRRLAVSAPPAEATRHLLAIGDRREAASAARRASLDADPTARADYLLLAADLLGQDAPDDLLLAAADAAIDAHRPVAASALAARVRGGGPVEAAAGLRLARAAWIAGDGALAARTVDEALRHVDGSTASPEHTELVVERAFIAVRLRVGDPGIVPLADEAVTMARGNGVGLARALNTAGLARSHSGQPGWDDYFRLAEQHATEVGDDEERLGACYWRLSALGFYGPMPDAVDLGATMVDATERLGARRWYHHFLGAHVIHLAGQGEVTQDRVTECRRLLHEAPHFRNRAQVELSLAVILADRGDLDGATELVDEAEQRASSAESRALLACARCEIALARRDVDAMRSALRALADGGAGFFGLNALAESAALHLAFAHPSAIDVPASSTTLTPVLDAVVLEREAYEHQLAGRLEEALGACHRAALRWEHHGMRRFARRARLGAAEIAAAAGDLDRVPALLRAVPEGVADVTARRSASLARAVERRRALGDLTPREGEILLLVARGLTSRAIAAQLGIGTTTVDSHVASAMRRLGARTRLQAATMVHG